MRKITALLSLLLLPVLHFAQQKHVAPQANVHADTVRFPANQDSLRIAVPKGGSADTNIFVLKDKPASNPFKDILPIITLLLGIGLNQLFDWNKERKRINKAGKRWIAELQGLDEPIRKQISLLETWLMENPESKYYYDNPVLISTLNGEIFKSLDKSELLSYIAKHRSKKNYKDAVKASNQVHGLVSILTNLYETLNKKFDEFQMGISAHTTECNGNLQMLSQAFARYGAALEQDLNGGDPITLPYYKAMLELFSDHIEPQRSTGSYDLFQLQEYFFTPLIQILAHLRHDQRTEEMANSTIGCLNAIRGIRMERRYWHKNVTTIIKRYTDNVTGINEVIEAIQNRQL